MTLPSLAVQVSGQNVVTADNFNSYVQNAYNLASLRTFTGLPGMEVSLEGYTTPGDGGQGRFYWNSTPGTDDGGLTTVVPNGSNSGCWSRIPNYFPPISPQALSNSGNITLSAANVINGVLTRAGGSTPTDTFPPASAIIGALPGLQPGSSKSLLVINENSGNLTLAPGAGDTFLGNLSTGNFVIANGVSRNFVLYVASASAVTVYG